MEDWQGWHRPGPTARQRRNDLGLAAAMAAGAGVAAVLVNSMGMFIYGSAPSLAEQLAWSVGMAVPLAVRRRFPATVLPIVAALFLAAHARHVGDNTAPSLALFVALYTLGAWGRDRVVARWVRVGVIVAMFARLAVSIARQLAGSPVFENAAGPLDPLLAVAVHSVGINLLYFLGAYLAGNLAWESARRRYELLVQGEQLRRSQAENARQAVVAERLRIAHDLHDVAAHHVSAMGVQAAAARRVLRTDQEQASRSLAAVEQTARTAVGELRDLVGVLRTGPPGPEPDPGSGATREYPSAPGLDQIAELVAGVRGSAGLQVRHAVFGDPRPVPESVALSAYRVVQEALTNTVRHAAAGQAEVRVRYLDRCLEVEVSDDGRGAGTPAAPPGVGGEPGSGGFGLLGMRERVAVHGGELDAGPRRGGGFQVRARFPLERTGPGAEPAPAGRAGAG